MLSFWHAGLLERYAISSWSNAFSAR